MIHRNTVGYTRKTVSEKFAISLTYDSDDIGDGNSISEAVVTCSGLTLGTPNIDGLVVEFSVAGGTAGTAYQIQVKITTSDGSVFIHYVHLNVGSD
jgi:hypothetical protein